MIKLTDSTVEHDIMEHCHLLFGSYYLSGQKVKINISNQSEIVNKEMTYDLNYSAGKLHYISTV